MRGLERNGNYLNLRLHLVVLRRLLILEPPVPRTLERISCMDHGLATLSCTRAREEGGKQSSWIGVSHFVATVETKPDMFGTVLLIKLDRPAILNLSFPPFPTQHLSLPFNLILEPNAPFHPAELETPPFFISQLVSERIFPSYPPSGLLRTATTHAACSDQPLHPCPPPRTVSAILKKLRREWPMNFFRL